MTWHARPSTSAEDEPSRCIACEQPLQAGEKVHSDLEGGFIHAECCGSDIESFVDEDGAPLKPGDPFPEPWEWDAGRPDVDARHEGEHDGERSP